MSSHARAPFSSLFAKVIVAIGTALVAACATQGTPEPDLSPVQGRTQRIEAVGGEDGVTINRRADDGVVVGKVIAPPETVWKALGEAFDARKVVPNIADRSVGRLGDTSLVMMRRWNGEAVSRYFDCGRTMTGTRADEERIRAVLLGQLTKLKGDTIAVAIHLSGSARPVASGNSGTISSCQSTGVAESDLLRDVLRRSDPYLRQVIKRSRP